MEENKNMDWKSVPVYKDSPDIARERNELDAYRVSGEANRACAKAIQEAVNENWTGSSLKEGCAKQVIDTFGMDRVMFVVANTIQLRDNDSRFNRDMRAWAQMVTMSGITEDRRYSWEIGVHSTKLNEFARQTREIIEAAFILDTPVYQEPYQYAYDNGETGPYWESHSLNRECARAIEESIADHFDGYTLHHGAPNAVLVKFGEERTLYVMANSIQLMRDDGRVSRKNIEWADTISIPHGTEADESLRRDFRVREHPGLFDMFVKVTRDTVHKAKAARLEQKIARQQERPSILAKLENRNSPSPKITHPTKKKDQAIEL